MNIIHRVCTLLSCSNSMTFRYFFLVIFKFSVTIGLAFTFENFFYNISCVKVIFDLTQFNIQNPGVHQNAYHSYCFITFVYPTLSLLWHLW